VILGAGNAIMNRVLYDDENIFKENVRYSFLFEAAIYFCVTLIALVISSMLIHTIYTERSSLWPKVKNEILSISIIIVITYIIKTAARIFIFLDGEKDLGQ